MISPSVDVPARGVAPFTSDFRPLAESGPSATGRVLNFDLRVVSMAVVISDLWGAGSAAQWGAGACAEPRFGRGEPSVPAREVARRTGFYSRACATFATFGRPTSMGESPMMVILPFARLKHKRLYAAIPPVEWPR
jgi:hypothetical protein